jgi:SAM-dependent methyltransferase
MNEVMNDIPNRELVGRYNRQATGYETHWAPVLNPMGARLVKRLRDRSRELGQSVRRVLDLGTGTGSLLPVLGRSFPGAMVMGIDRSPGMLARVSGDPSRAAMDAEYIGLRDHCIDVVTLAFMLFHLGDPVRGLTEVRRTLRPGGVVGTVTWAGDFTSQAGAIWEEELDAHGAPPLDPDVPGTGHDRTDTPEKITGLLAAAGFVGIRASRESVEHTFDMESLLALRTSCGKNLPRYRALDPEVQAACLGQARNRLSPLPPEAYLTRGNLVYAVANLEPGVPHDR